MNDKELTKRKHPFHLPPKFSHSKPIILYVTVCTHQRQPLLANQTMHETLIQAWKQASDWLIGRYVLMPDHLHLFCAPLSSAASNLNQWVRFWKSTSARKCPSKTKLWQRDFWDTQLRRSESYESKWAYVRNNPVRAGLVSQPDNWPYQGELYALAWHD
jgi:putative transposase